MEPEQKNKRKGIIATVMYHIILLLLFLFVGLTYQDPPPEDGIAINFGYEDDGSGNTTQSAPQQPQQEEVEKETAETIDEEVATQEVEEAPNVTEEKVEKPKEKPKEEPKEEPIPAPDSRLQNALDKTKNQEGQGEGEGEKEGGADQGDPNGDRNSPNRTGGSGQGDGNYNLDGRSVVNKQKPIYDCTEEGRVVVKVRVGRDGKTISAEAGVNFGKYNTNTAAPCLLKRAKEAAMKTTWSPKSDATIQQTGHIIYNFKKR